MTTEVPVVLIVHSGGFWKYPVFEIARRLGYRTIVADDRNFLESTLRAGIGNKVDHLFGVDVYDDSAFIPQIDAELRRIGLNRPDGVTTLFELAVEQTARLATYYNVAGNLPEMARRARNKFAMRRAIGDPYFEGACQKVETVGQLRNFCKKLGGARVILKPCDLAASTGVKRIANAREIAPAWFESTDALAKFETLYRYTSASGLMAERMMPLGSREYNVDMLVDNGRPYVIGVAEKEEVLDGPDFQENAYVFPPYSIDAAQIEALKDESRRAVRAVGITTGAVHLEAKMIEDRGTLRPCVIELGARCGGDLEMEGLREHRRNAVDLRELVLKQAVGRLTDRDLELARRCDEEGMPSVAVAVCVKYAEHPGVLARAPELPQHVRESCAVIDAVFEAGAGHPVVLPKNDYLGAVMCAAEEPELALRYVNDAVSQIVLDMTAERKEEAV